MAKERKKSGYGKLRKFIKIQVILLVVVFFGLCIYYFGGYGAKIKILHDNGVSKARSSTEETFRASQTSLVYDKDNELISALKGEKDVYYITIDKIPAYVQKAFICTEDKKFYKHNGIDLGAIIRAFKGMIENQEIVSGASTITQQLSRNVFLTQDVTWERKVEEIFIAMELEKIYSKDKILEFYINNIYFANGHYGIQAASQGYFSKDVNSLSLSEMIFLCAIPNNPSLYDPVDNMENTIKRRDRILNIMHTEGYITDKQYDEAVNQEIVLNITDLEQHDYVETYTYNCAIKALMKQQGFEFRTEFDSVSDEIAYEEAFDDLYYKCQRTLYTAGYRIYTSIDLDVQSNLQSIVDSTMSEYTTVNPEGIYQLQGAAVCINNATGKVEAIVGGRSQDVVKGYTLNRGYQSVRQPGSTIKPLIVYTPILERGYTPESIVVDEPIIDGPENADLTYSGEMTIRQAVAKSKNTVAWKLFEDITPQIGLSYLKKMNFNNIYREDYNLAVSLGGFSRGVSAVEMASAYATLENDGMYREPTCIVKITDADGNIICGRNEAEKEIYNSNASRMMTSMLETVMKEGTGKGYALAGMPCAGKTGTTNDNKDSWFVGFTHYYTTCVWVGYDIPQQLPGQSPQYPLIIWKAFMDKLHEGLEPMEFLSYIE